MKNGVSASKQHKDDLAELAKVDPEFFKFLKKEDAGLLNFNLDDEDDLDDDDPEQKVHQLPGELVEMEEEEEDDPEAKQQVTLEMIEKWASQLQVSPSPLSARLSFPIHSEKSTDVEHHSFGHSSLWLRGAIGLWRTGEKRRQKEETTKDRRHRRSRMSVSLSFSLRVFIPPFPRLAFNAIVRVCLKQLLPGLYRFLRLKPTNTSKVKPESSTNWKYIEPTLKKYLTNFTRVNLSLFV